MGVDNNIQEEGKKTERRAEPENLLTYIKNGTGKINPEMKELLQNIIDSKTKSEKL